MVAISATIRLADAQITRIPVRLQSVAALAEEVELQQVGVTLSSLLERLSKQYGVAMAAEGAAMADQKLIVYSPRRPLVGQMT